MPGFRSIFCPRGLVLGAGRAAAVEGIFAATVFFAVLFFATLLRGAVFRVAAFFAEVFFTAGRFEGRRVVGAMHPCLARPFACAQWQVPRPWSRTPPPTGRNSQVYAPSSSVSFINPNVPASRTSLFGSAVPKA